ncbi:MAG: hypothetical protein LAT65_19800 [Saccharospirillum sp.]|nr:hypothetical protein [Saccharospirillum sp.]
MIWHLVAVVFAGLGAAGIALGLRVVSGKRLPKWIIPVFAGMGMLSYQIYFEYNWFNFKQEQLPAGSVVVETEEGQVFWRPWTLRYPMTIGFTVIEPEQVSIRVQDEYTIAHFRTYRFEKQHIDVVTTQEYLMNCETGDRVPVVSGSIDHTRTINFNDNHQLYMTVCP